MSFWKQAAPVKMVYEYKTAKKVDNSVQADLSKLKGRSVVVTGGMLLVNTLLHLS
jgi:hypothetical protein